MRLVYLSLAWVLGIFLGSRYGLGWGTASVLLGIFALFAIISHQRKALIWSGLCLLLLFGGILRFQSVSDSDALASYRGFFELRGVVAADPDIRDYATTLRLEVSEIMVDGEWRDVSGKTLVNAPRFPDLGNSRDFPYYRYGDRLEMGGMLESPEKIEEFDFKEYLARQGIYSIMSRPRGIKLIDTDQKPKPMELIYRLRNSMSQSMDKALPEPQSSLAKAILIGERGSMSPQVKEDFSKTGTSHLLAISGSNVSIVAGMALGAGVWAFGRKRPTYFFLALGVIWFYTILAGMSPPVVRAAIMGSMWLWADSLGRPNSAFVALALTVAVMLAIDPLLLGDVGFQLSFAAMAGLVLLTPTFHRLGKKTFGNQEGEVGSTTNFLIVSCAVTTGAVLTTLPLIAYYFGMISIMSMPATLFALPAMPGIMVAAGLVGLVGIFAPAAAWVLGWVAWLFVTYMLKVVQIFADIPFASVDIKVSAASVGVYYGILVAALWLPKNGKGVTDKFGKVKERLRKAPQLAAKAPAKWIVLPLVVAAVLIWVAALTASDGRLHISVLDIGQGDAILISKGNQQILIDGGPSAAKLSNELGGKLPFWDRTIELVVLTHPDSDHLTGLVEVLGRYKVKMILTSGEEIDSDVYREWRKLIAEKGVECVTAEAGQEISLGKGVRLAVLNPPDHLIGGAPADLNDNSVVLRLEDKRFSMLLTGDIGAEAEKALLAENVRLQSTVLKVSHHGSNTATSADFLAEVKPMLAVISVGAENKFGHPAPEVFSRLQTAVGDDRLFLTSENGAIEFITDGEKLWVDTKR